MFSPAILSVEVLLNLWTWQKQNVTEIYHWIPVYHNTVHNEEIQNILLHFQQMQLEGSLGNTSGKRSISIKVKGYNKNYSKVSPHI